MRSRRAASIVALLAAAALSGCGGRVLDREAPLATHPYASLYRGSYAGSDSGSWWARVGPTGALTASVTPRRGRAFTLTGTVSSSGAMTATGSGAGKGVTWRGKFGRSGGTRVGRGTWQGPSNRRGSWSGSETVATGTVKGALRGTSGGSFVPLGGRSVSIGNRTADTKAGTGAFTIAGVPPGAYTIKVRAAPGDGSVLNPDRLRGTVAPGQTVNVGWILMGPPPP